MKQYIQMISQIAKFKHSKFDVFSLFRAHKESQVMASLMKDEDGNTRSFKEWKEDVQQFVNPRWNNAWLKTEYDTAVLRSKQAGDWKQFTEDADVWPNLKWMPTSSVNQDEVHKEFWSKGLVLPVEDSFWNEHHPADHWNCKCWLKQTDEDATEKKDVPPITKAMEPQPGLKGNPGKTGEMISQNHPYFADKCATCFANTDGKVHGLKGKVNNASIIKGNCSICEMASKCVERIDKSCKSLPTIAPVIERKLNEFETKKEQQKFLQDIQQNKDAEVILQSSKAKTRMYEGCQGPESKSWERTKSLAQDLNDNGKDVTFLAEHRDMTCADAIVEYKGRLVIADFKCSSTKKPNTLFHDIEKGYQQANTIVLKLEKMDSGQFKEAIKQFIRNYEDENSKHYKDVRLGKMILVNKYGKLIELERKDFINTSYEKKIKGFL